MLPINDEKPSISIKMAEFRDYEAVSQPFYVAKASYMLVIIHPMCTLADGLLLEALCRAERRQVRRVMDAAGSGPGELDVPPRRAVSHV